MQIKEMIKTELKKVKINQDFIINDDIKYIGFTFKRGKYIRMFKKFECWTYTGTGKYIFFFKGDTKVIKIKIINVKIIHA